MSETSAEAKEKPKKKDRSPWILGGAVGASVVWFVWAALVLLGSHGCNDAQGDWWSTHVSCLTPNVIGDTLGGGFAPLALVWLVTAVLLQGSELRAQRQELELTRDEMKESREVLAAQKGAMDAQVVEARRTVDLIGGQVEAQKTAYQRSEEIEAGRIVDDLVSVARGIITQNPIMVHLATIINGETQWNWSIGSNERLRDFALVKEFNEKLLGYTNLVEQIQRNAPTSRTGVVRLQELAMVYEMIVTFRAQTASSKHLQVGLLKIELTLAQLKLMMDALGVEHQVRVVQ